MKRFFKILENIWDNLVDGFELLIFMVIAAIIAAIGLGIIGIPLYLSFTHSPFWLFAIPIVVIIEASIFFGVFEDKIDFDIETHKDILQDIRDKLNEK